MFVFGKVTGKFDCMGCEQLNTLNGAPKEVGGNFDCSFVGKSFTKDDIEQLSNVKGSIACKS